MSCQGITFLIRSLGQGGAERQLVLLADGLQKRGHRVRILTFYPGGSFEEVAKTRGLEVQCLEKKGRWDLIPFFARLIKALRRPGTDVVHGYLASSNVALALFKWAYRRPLVWGLRASKKNFADAGRMAQLEAWIEARLSNIPDLVIANSEAGRTHALSLGFPADRLKVVENGFDCAGWCRDEAAGVRWRASVGISRDVPLVGVLGRLSPVKGHATFLKAAQRVHQNRPDVRFAIIGSGPGSYLEALKAQAGALGLVDNMHWIPGQSEMNAVYSALTVLASTSLSEGFPNVVAEGMACGLYPVVTDVGDCARLVGDCGWVVPPENVEKIAEAMLEALAFHSEGCQAGDEKTARPDPRAFIRAHYGIEQLVTRTEALLSGLGR